MRNGDSAIRKHIRKHKRRTFGAVEIIKNEYPESQWNDYAVDKMEAAIIEAGGGN